MMNMFFRANNIRSNKKHKQQQQKGPIMREMEKNKTTKEIEVADTKND